MLQINAANGLPLLRFGDRMFKFMGIMSVGWSYTGTQQSGAIVDGRFTQYPGCEPLVFVIAAGFDIDGGAVALSISGDTLTWSYAKPEALPRNRVNATVAYGIF
jgi:hypothetical protein